jgi:hypothetical protein
VTPVRALVPAALAVALALPARAAEAAPLRIALEPLRAAGVSPVLASLVEERVCAALAEAARADVVCPADVEAAAALAKRSMELGECRADDCVRRVDAFRAADRRVTGALERAPGGLVLSLQLAGPAGPGARVAEALPEDVDGLVARLPALVRRLFP